MINKRLRKYFNYNQLENIKYHSFLIFSQTIIQFFFPPIILIIWGVKNYGAWLYLISFMSIASHILIPITEVVRLEMTKAYANKKNIYLNEIFFSSIIWHSLNIFIIILLSIILKNFINLQSNFISEVKNIDINFIFFILILKAFFDVFNSFLYPVLTFQGKVKLWNNIEISYEIISKLTILVSALLFEFNYVIFAYFLSSVLKFLIVFYYYFLNYKKNFYISRSFFNFQTSKKIFFLSTTYFLERISFSIKNDGFLFLIGTYFGATAISLLSTMKTIFYFLPMKISSILNFSSLIEFSKLKFTSYKKIPSIQKNYLKLILFFLFFFIVSSVLLGKLFYGLWMHNIELNFDYKIMLFLITEVSIIILFNTIITPFKSFNKFFNISVIDLLNSSIAFFLCFIAIKTSSNLYLLFFITVVMCLFNLLITASLYKNYLKKIYEK